MTAAEALQGAVAGGWSALAIFLLGYGLKWLEGWFTHARTREREREARDDARRAQRREARIAFQRQTLLDLQEAMQQLARSAGAAHHHDLMAHRAGAPWGETSPAGLSQRCRSSGSIALKHFCGAGSGRTGSRNGVSDEGCDRADIAR
jgi:hypothetical protein